MHVTGTCCAGFRPLHLKSMACAASDPKGGEIDLGSTPVRQPSQPAQGDHQALVTTLENAGVKWMCHVPSQSTRGMAPGSRFPRRRPDDGRGQSLGTGSLLAC